MSGQQDKDRQSVVGSVAVDGSAKTAIGEVTNIAKLLEEQLATSEEILREVALIKGHIRWQKIWGTLRFFLIVVPIILGLLYGLLYLPPEVKEILDYYRSLFRP